MDDKESFDKSLVNEIQLDDFLWEVVSDKISEVNEVKKMLKDIKYVEDIETVLNSMQGSELFETEYFKILKKTIIDSDVQINFEMPYILNTLEESEQILRVTGFVSGECTISNDRMSDLASMNLLELNRIKLLSLKEFVKFNNLSYSDCECDDLRVV